jgi:hypothetical protein
VGPPPRGSHISETTLQNRRMAKIERFQEFDGQRFLVFAFDGQNQTSTIVRWPKKDFFLACMLVPHLMRDDSSLTFLFALHFTQELTKMSVLYCVYPQS